MLGNGHIVDGDLHLACSIGHVEVGGSGAVRNRQRGRDVDAHGGTPRLEGNRQLVGAKHRDQPYVNSQQGQVVGDVSAHTPVREPHGSHVGVMRNERTRGRARNVHVCAAHYDDVGLCTHNRPFTMGGFIAAVRQV